VHRNVGIDMPFCHHIYSDYRLGEDSENAGEKSGDLNLGRY